MSTLKDGSDMKPIFDKIVSPFDKLNNKHKPSKPSEEADAVDVDIYKEELKQFVTRSANLQRNLEKTFGLIWGQCSNALQADIKGIQDYTDKFEDLDSLWLITELKKLTSGIDSRSDPRLTFHRALAELYKLYQGETESNDKYHERFKICINTVEPAQGRSVFALKAWQRHP